MPSPLGHALGGAAIGLLASRRAPRPFLLAASFALIACLPDLDLFTRQHSGMTHSIGFAALAALIAGLAQRDKRFALAAAAAYASHILFDWLGEDTAPPLGVMALWPFSTEYFMAPFTPLPPVSRRYWMPGFWTHTVKVALFELTVFGVLAALAWTRHRTRSRA